MSEQQGQEPEHYDYGPSSASRWKNCPGSVLGIRELRSKGLLNENDEGDVAARIGTYGHALMEGFLDGKIVEHDPVMDELDPDQKKTFYRLLAGCIEALPRPIDCGGSNFGQYEQHLELKIKSDTVPNHGGTMDIARYYPAFAHLHVIDWKFGHQAVEIENNDQIQCYLNLARQKWPDAKNFTGTIIQPAYKGAQTLTFTQHQLDHHLAQVKHAAKSSYRKAKSSWCKYCPLTRHNCGHFNALLHQTAQQFDDLLTTELTEKTTYELPSEEDVRLVEESVALYRIATKAMEDASKLLKTWHANGVVLKRHRVQTVNSQKLTTSETALDKSNIPLHIYTRLDTITNIRKSLKLTKSEFAKRYPQLVTEIQSTRLISSTQTEMSDFDFTD